MDGSLIVSGIALTVSTASYVRSYRNDDSVARPSQLEVVTVDNRKMALVLIRSNTKVECVVDSVWLAYGTRPWCGVGREGKFNVIDLDVDLEAGMAYALPGEQNPEDSRLILPPKLTQKVFAPWDGILASLTEKFPQGATVYLRPVIKFDSQRKRRAYKEFKVHVPAGVVSGPAPTPDPAEALPPGPP